jgi:hypothetical protein
MHFASSAAPVEQLVVFGLARAEYSREEVVAVAPKAVQGLRLRWSLLRQLLRVLRYSGKTRGWKLVHDIPNSNSHKVHSME